MEISANLKSIFKYLHHYSKRFPISLAFTLLGKIKMFCTKSQVKYTMFSMHFHLDVSSIFSFQSKKKSIKHQFCTQQWKLFVFVRPPHCWLIELPLVGQNVFHWFWAVEKILRFFTQFFTFKEWIGYFFAFKNQKENVVSLFKSLYFSLLLRSMNRFRMEAPVDKRQIRCLFRLWCNITFKFIVKKHS